MVERAGLNKTSRNKLQKFSLVLANGETESAIMEAGSLVVGGFIFPTSFTGTSVTFKAYIDNTATGYPLDDFEDNSTTFTLAITNLNHFTPVDFRRFAGIAKWSIVSNASQTGAVSITVMGREIS